MHVQPWQSKVWGPVAIKGNNWGQTFTNAEKGTKPYLKELAVSPFKIKTNSSQIEGQEGWVRERESEQNVPFFRPRSNCQDEKENILALQSCE